jgi:hypothetical protein
MLTNRVGFLSSSLCALTLAACGALANSDTQPPPLAVIEGTLSLAAGSGAPEGPIRVALLWWKPEDVEFLTSSADGTSPECSARGRLAYPVRKRLSFDVAQQAVEIHGEFPSHFALKLTAPPPKEVAPDVDSEVSDYARASLVVYRDGNGDGILNGRSQDKSSPDVVLADTDPVMLALRFGAERTSHRRRSYRVYFAVRPAYLTPYVTLRPGYNLVASFDEEPDLAQRDLLLGSADTIDVELSDSPLQQQLLCDDRCGAPIESVEQCPATPGELPVIEADNPEAYFGSSLRANGPDRYTYNAYYCTTVRNPQNKAAYFYEWLRQVVDGCNIEEFKNCGFVETAPLQGVPCTDYDLDYTNAPRSNRVRPEGVPELVGPDVPEECEFPSNGCDGCGNAQCAPGMSLTSACTCEDQQTLEQVHPLTQTCDFCCGKRCPEGQFLNYICRCY